MKREPKSFEEMLLFSVPLIKVKYKDGSEAQGTSFFIAYEYKVQNEKKVMIFLVTNKHIIENSISQKISLHYKDKNGYPTLDRHKEVELNNIEFKWFLDEKSDIAILNLSANLKEYNDLYYQTIPVFFEKLKPKDSDIDVIENVVFIGYPNGLYDKKNLLPIVRKGITATSYNFDFEGKPKFLIDASVFQGSSGSPVFILDTGKSVNGKKITLAGNRVYFLGILASVYFKDDEHLIDEKTYFTRQMIDIGTVYKSSEIERLIKKFIEELNEFSKEYEQISKIKNENIFYTKILELFSKYQIFDSSIINEFLHQQKNNNLTDFENEEIEVIKEWIEDKNNFVSKIRDTIANDFQNEDSEIVKKAKIISNLFNKYDSDYPKNITITRGLRFDINNSKRLNDFKKLIRIFNDGYNHNEEIIFDLAPMSTSKNSDIADGFASVEDKNHYSIVIYFKLRYTSEIDLSIINESEKEILINGNLIYKVVSFEMEEEKNIYFIELKEVKND